MEARDPLSAPSRRTKSSEALLRSPRVEGIVHGRTIPETKSSQPDDEEEAILTDGLFPFVGLRGFEAEQRPFDLRSFEHGFGAQSHGWRCEPRSRP